MASMKILKEIILSESDLVKMYDQVKTITGAPYWIDNGNIMPISFEGISHVEGCLRCPRCGHTDITGDQDVLKTVPYRVVNGLRIGFMCNPCAKSQCARNPAQVLNIVPEDGKIYLRWEK